MICCTIDQIIMLLSTFVPGVIMLLTLSVEINNGNINVEKIIIHTIYMY